MIGVKREKTSCICMTSGDAPQFCIRKISVNVCVIDVSNRRSESIVIMAVIESLAHFVK